MNKRLMTVFLILTIIPVGLLGLLAVYGYRVGEDRHQRRIEALGIERLKTINLQVEQYFHNLETELLKLPRFLESTITVEAETEEVNRGNLTRTDIEKIRNMTRNSYIFRQFFILGEHNTLLYPSKDIPLSEAEQDFLLRTKEIGISRGMFIGGERENMGTTSDASSVPSASADIPTAPKQGFREYGWYTWYLGEGINFIFWRRYENNILGIELNRMAVISDIIRSLPSTDPEAKDQFRVVLKDISGNELYIWGSYNPKGDSETVSMSAANPLSSWKLEYYLPVGTEEGNISRVLPIFGIVSFLVLIIIGLAVYLYRESTREIREAYQKVSFVNQVSHELKTPLTNIRMYAELLENSVPESNKKGIQYIEVISAESKRLSRLISNVLTFAKDQRKAVHFTPTEEILDKIVRDVVENFRPSLEEKSIMPVLDLDAHAKVMLDKAIVEQIVSNLISNVEKYASEGKYLGITTRQTAGTSTIFVSDNGPGIPRKFRERIFVPFYRISNRNTDGIAGTGIGLSIVRSLAKLHSGSAAVAPSNSGTTIKIVLSTPAK